MTRTWPALITVVLAATAMLTAQVGRPPDPLPASIVVVYATVETNVGTMVTDLTRDDFEIASAGAVLPVTYFSSAPPALKVILLADLSSSVTGSVRSPWTAPWIDGLTLAADLFIKGLGADDRGRIMAIAGSRFPASGEWTNDRRILGRAAALFVPPAGVVEPSPLWDAIDEALPLFAGQSGRRAIVLLTDGRPSGNRMHLAEVSHRAMVAGVAVSTLELGGPGQRQGPAVVDPNPTTFLRTLAASTGGMYAFVQREMRGGHNPGPLVARMIERLRGAYTLGFVLPAGDTMVRPIEVRVGRPGTTVHARQEYEVGRP